MMALEGEGIVRPQADTGSEVKVKSKIAVTLPLSYGYGIGKQRETNLQRISLFKLIQSVPIKVNG